MTENNILLDIRNLSKNYGSFKALDKVNLSIKHKDFYALLGANGAGKTTIIGIVTDLIMPSEGEILVNGYHLRTQTSLAKLNIGVVPQEINLNTFERVDQTLYQQAQYYGLKPSKVRDRVDYLLKKLLLTDKKSSTVVQLSGGMKRRLMIARALIHSPKILLLDEPTAGVDVEVRRSLWRFLRQENDRGLTIVLTTHYLEEAEALCNRVCMIKNGQRMFEGDMKQLLSELKGETIIVEMETDQLKLTKNLKQQCVDITPHSLEIEMRKDQTLQEVINEINKSKGSIIRIEHQASRLEQVFTQTLTDN